MFNEEGSFVMGAIGLLVGFVSLLPMLTTGRRWVAAISLILGTALIIHGFYRRANRDRVTMENIQSKIRDWISAFGFHTKPISHNDWHFGIEALIPMRETVWILRTKQRAQYITMIASVDATPEQSALYDQKNPVDRAVFWRDIALETSRARIASNRVARRENTTNRDEIFRLSITQRIPITEDLSEAATIDALQNLDFSVTIVRNTLAILLPIQRQALPDSTVETETPPSKPPSSRPEPEMIPPPD